MLLAGLLLVTGGTAPAAAAVRLSVSGPTSLNAGIKGTLKIRYSTKAGGATGNVWLEEKHKGGSWTRVGKVAVSGGKASVTVRPTRTTWYRVARGSHVSRAHKVSVVRSWIGFTVGATTVDAGRSVTGTVKLTRSGALSSGNVVLQRRTTGGWEDVATYHVPSSGRMTISIRPEAPTTRYRVVRKNLVSKTRTVTTVDRVTLSLDPREVSNPGASVTGSVRWWKNGRPATGSVTLQEKVDGSWRTVTTLRVKDGRASFTVEPRTTRSYRVKAGSLTSSSKKVTVHGVVPASFSIRGAGWGHGLGMSQYGAYAMALEGASTPEILTHYYTDTATEYIEFPTGNASSEQLGVQVLGPPTDTRTFTTLTIHDGGWRLRDEDGTTVASASAPGSITVKIESGKLAAYLGSAGTPVVRDERLHLHWEGTRYYLPDSTRKTYVTVSGAHGSYRHGRLEIAIIDGKVNVVNNLLLNTEYLYGIAEMPSSWGKSGPKALRAQAVAARNYAAQRFFDSEGKPKRRRNSGPGACRCHIYDDTRDQYFSGWTKENEGGGSVGKYWKDAVDATVKSGGARGMVLRYVGSDKTYAGKLVDTYYSSSTGGASLNSEDTWSAKVPYLRSVKDPWSLKESSGNPYREWVATMTQNEARAFFGLPDVVSVEVTRRYQGGAVAELRATSSTGKTSVVSGKADAMRTRLNNASSGYVRSAFVTAFDPVGVHPG